MQRVTAFMATLALLFCSNLASAQDTEYIFDPPSTGELTDPFPVGDHNGARGLSGPWDLDQDGQVEVLITQHNAAGGRVYVAEHRGGDSWEMVYATAFIDSSASSNNARYATGGDLDGDGNWEIIYVAGMGYSETNPIPDLVPGVYVWEHDGVEGSDDYGELPATIGNFPELDEIESPNVHAQNLEARDIDNDGVQELLVPVNGGNEQDIMYILSVSETFEPDGYANTFASWQIEKRVAPREGGNAYGGGSPIDMISADLNGDGNLDISYHTWNYLNFFNATVDGADNIVLADPAAENRFLQATFPEDQVGLFGGVAADIDEDGNEEVFYTNLHTADITVIDYDDGEDALQITADNVAVDAIEIGGSGGIAVGDTDGDGQMELIVGGPGYSGSNYDAGEPSSFIRIAEYNGGDPSDGANYTVYAIDTSHPADTSGFNIIYRDSLGTMTRYRETAQAKQGSLSSSEADPVFASGITYLGDIDEDGFAEIAVSFQGVDDSLYIADDVWDPESVTGVFNTPVDAGEPGPIDSGQAYEFTIEAEPGQRLSFATMFVPSNDLFYAPSDVGIALYDEEGAARSGDVTNEIWLWDAGTEENQEPGMGSNQPANQPEPNTGPDDPDTDVRHVDDEFTYPDSTDVIQVTLTPGDDNTFTVRIENVSTGTTLNGDSSVPLAPGVWVLHEGSGAIFTEGGTASEGLESLAEDGDPSTMAEELQAKFGFVRTIRERLAAPVRPFMRVIEVPSSLASAREDLAEVPDGFELHQNYPNPFNPSTTLRFTLPQDARVSVRVYDVMGRLVDTLVDDQTYPIGTHQLTWNGMNAAGSRVASGTYFYTLEHGGQRIARAMLLIK